MSRPYRAILIVLVSGLAACVSDTRQPTAAAIAGWEQDNPVRPIPTGPLGTRIDLATLDVPPTPQRVRLGRWLFFDRRLSGDHSLSCASCHQPEHAFSQVIPVAIGAKGQPGRRKVPSIINLAIPRPYNFFTSPGAFFWDGRARTLEQQVLEPIANPIEMANSHAHMVETLSGVQGYARYFSQAFGDSRITKERIAQAIADYERTRMSGNAPFDKWQAGDRTAISPEAKRGHALFTGRAECAQCHGGPLFTTGGFRNTGVGWNAATRRFADEGRYAITKGTMLEEDPGTFKTPGLREVTRHAPYMNDGSIATLREAVEFYNRGGNPNPDINIKPLGLTSAEIDAIVAFLKTLEGEGWQDAGPSRFPQ